MYFQEYHISMETNVNSMKFKFYMNEICSINVHTTNTP